MAEIDTSNSAIEPVISNLIQSMFPSFYSDNDGQMFMTFVQSYFEWLEQPGNPVYYARRHIQNHDIDLAAEQFLIHFKNKFTPDIIYNSESSIPDMVKHSLEFYRSKGADLSFNLFFSLVYGVPATIKHPGDYVFTLSSGNWHKDIYLELTPSETNNQFIGQEILGVNSGATAFVDRLVRRIIGSRIVDVVYISAINGTFHFGELITLNVT